MTVTALPAAEPSALDLYVTEIRIRNARALVRGLIAKAWSTEISHSQAVRILAASGIVVTETEVEDATEWLDTLDSPAARAESIAVDEGYDGNLDEAKYAVASAAQHDLDVLVERLAREATPVCTETAVLEVVDVMVGER